MNSEIDHLSMQCPDCKSEHVRKNGKNKQGKQNYICVSCSRQFILDYEPHKGYSDELRQECLTMYVNGMGLRAIARVKKIHHTTVRALGQTSGSITAECL